MEATAVIEDYPGMSARIQTTADIQERLALLRRAIAGDGHGSQVAFCKQAGITTNAWSNIERGPNRISVDSALLLSKAFGVSLDWIYQGEAYERFLPGDLIEKLRQARERPPLGPAKKQSPRAARTG